MKESQRDDTFKGGIQVGTSATSIESSSLDQAVRIFAETATLPEGWTHIRGFAGNALAARLGTNTPQVGIYPDGGIILNEAGEVMIAFEAKKNGKSGNAIERWDKNNRILTYLGCRRYITFCVGEGFFDGNYPERFFNNVAAIKYAEETGTGLKQDYWNTDAVLQQINLYRYRTSAEATLNIEEIIKAAILNLQQKDTSSSTPTVTP